MASPGYHEDQEDDDDDDGGVYQPGYIPDQFEKKRSKKVEFIILIEWIALFSILGFLIVSLTVDKLSSLYVSGLRIWRWCVLVLVFFCGHLVTQWFTELLVFVIERNYLLKNKVLYFLYSLRKSFRVSLWLGLVLIAWALLINRGVKRSRHTMRVLNHITRALASSLIGSVLWMTLSGPALMENADTAGRFRNSGRLSFKYSMKGKQKGKGDEVVNVDKLYNLTREKISSFTMNGLVQVIRTSGLSTISDALERSDDDEEVPQKEIVSEVEAKAAARDIFKKVAKSGNRYIDEGDLLRFFPPEEVGNVLPLFEGTAQTGQIMKASFKSWVVKVYNERKYLAHSLNDAKTAVEELNKISSAIILVVIIIVWLLLMGFATTKVLVFISSQLLLVVFMFGNTAKTVFEAMVFVFGTHPFDVGDRCVVDGVQMIVEEMNILTTIFLRYDNQMIYYPNSILATKPITNFNRSPPLGDSVEFSVDFSTSVESIAALKAKLKGYLESKPEQWQPSHSVQIKEIEDVNKLKMALYVTHAINSSSSQRSSHRSDLVLELKKIFEVLQINYHLLPQEVHVRYVGSEFPPSNTY
nr:mechanosensitive ion channel protein 10-like isoform X2 [Coffea arabica]